MTKEEFARKVDAAIEKYCMDGLCPATADCPGCALANVEGSLIDVLYNALTPPDKDQRRLKL